MTASISVKQSLPTTKLQSKEFDPKPYMKSGLKDSQVRQIKETFDLLDMNHVGSINPSQLKAALLALGNQATHKQIYQLICDLEAEGRGYIGFEQFVHLFTEKVTSKESRSDIQKVFCLYDEDKTGYISIKNLRNISRDVGQPLSEEQLQFMVNYADLDKDGFVSVDQFYRIVTKFRRNE